MIFFLRKRIVGSWRSIASYSKSTKANFSTLSSSSSFLFFIILIQSSSIIPQKKKPKNQIIKNSINHQFSHTHLKTWTLSSTMAATTTPSRSPYYSHTQFLRLPNFVSWRNLIRNRRRNWFQIHRFLSHRRRTRHNIVASSTKSIILCCM